MWSHKTRPVRRPAPRHFLPRVKLKQQRYQRDGNQAQQAGQKHSPRTQLGAAAIFLPQQGGGGRGGHGHIDEQRPYHQAVQAWDQPHQPPGQYRKEEQPGPGGGKGVSVPQDIGHSALGQVHPGNNHGQGRGGVGQVAQGGEDSLGQLDLCEIQHQSNHCGQIDDTEHRLFPGDGPVLPLPGQVHAHQPRPHAVQHEVEGDGQNHRQRQPLLPKEGQRHWKAHKPIVAEGGAAAPHPPPAVRNFQQAGQAQR